MALIDDVGAICGRLVAAGWADLFRHHGLDIDQADLETELLRELPGIDRSLPGFEDFRTDGVRGVEPGDPSRSLLYHALASPAVRVNRHDDATSTYPTLAEIDLVENYVFAARKWSLDDLLARAGNDLPAVAVFATQYHAAPHTPHGLHADLCVSRTGIARVGTAQPLYDSQRRGFVPLADDPTGIRVLPSRFAAYLAVERTGTEGLLGLKMAVGDDRRSFWVPLHKLFSGPECLVGEVLSIALVTEHTNEKLRRIHMHFAGQAGWASPDIDQAPFVFHEGIAEMNDPDQYGPGVLVPTVHPHLVEQADYQGRPLGFTVIPSENHGLGPSLLLRSLPSGARGAPEFVHVRHLLSDGQVRDLNDLPDVADRVFAGGYKALHYLDFTGDGWVQAEAPELAVEVPRNIPAYSIVAAPDFYPCTSQRDLLAWWNRRLPQRLKDLVKWRAAPETLADTRLPPNVALSGVDFRAEDDTVSAVLAPTPATPGPTHTRPADLGARHAHLPDAAAGIFAPGWDTSSAETNGVLHLAAYGLGSPFPEDAKLCAALSAFWPAVAPDTARSFSHGGPKGPADGPPFRTVTPMTDEEIGSVGDLPWDGVPGPRLVDSPDAARAIEYASFDHVDYVRTALDGRFSMAITGTVDTQTYEARILAVARAYQAAGVSLREAGGLWVVVSFRQAAADGEVVVEAQAETGISLQGQLYAVTLCRRGQPTHVEGDHRRVRVPVEETTTVLIGAQALALVRFDGSGWQVRPVD